ncbi:Argininosuccinate synthase [Portunus trituberculatus]|uniref:argininosuccinate synthase n=1 Tax=Portunus trituberculatus TaxID=210409 RepID=A0A5B7H6G8_PORTR|nr:Argininosuccinate synthase [Portunus trituberculatus]
MLILEFYVCVATRSNSSFQLSTYIAVKPSTILNRIHDQQTVQLSFLAQSRGVYETPGLTLLHAAHHDLEVLCLDREVRKIKTELSTRMAEQVYNGFWFSPEFEYTRRCVEASQEMVTGSVSLKVYKGNGRCKYRRMQEFKS